MFSVVVDGIIHPAGVSNKRGFWVNVGDEISNWKIDEGYECWSMIHNPRTCISKRLTPIIETSKFPTWNQVYINVQVCPSQYTREQATNSERTNWLDSRNHLINSEFLVNSYHLVQVSRSRQRAAQISRRNKVEYLLACSMVSCGTRNWKLWKNL